jgi:hypothetical protein
MLLKNVEIVAFLSVEFRKTVHSSFFEDSLAIAIATSSRIFRVALLSRRFKIR